MAFLARPALASKMPLLGGFRAAPLDTMALGFVNRGVEPARPLRGPVRDIPGA
jgi:hypothetical protein